MARQVTLSRLRDMLDAAAKNQERVALDLRGNDNPQVVSLEREAAHKACAYRAALRATNGQWIGLAIDAGL